MIANSKCLDFYQESKEMHCDNPGREYLGGSKTRCWPHHQSFVPQIISSSCWSIPFYEPPVLVLRTKRNEAGVRIDCPSCNHDPPLLPPAPAPLELLLLPFNTLEIPLATNILWSCGHGKLTSDGQVRAVTIQSSSWILTPLLLLSSSSSRALFKMLALPMVNWNGNLAW